MDKLKMAHDWYMKHSEGSSFMYADVKQAWKYADAMQAEADKRNKAEAVITDQDKQRIEQVYSNIVKPPIIDGWQPDWSQAPEWAKAWTRDRFGGQWWDTTPSRGIDLWIADPRVPYECENAPDFNYQGNWQDSLRKRPSNI